MLENTGKCLSRATIDCVLWANTTDCGFSTIFNTTTFNAEVASYSETHVSYFVTLVCARISLHMY